MTLVSVLACYFFYGSPSPAHTLLLLDLLLTGGQGGF
jgi:hypothetical protein